MEDLTLYIKRNRNGKRHVIAPITCADGFTMSVQASQYHYCAPRNNKGPWTTVEIGYPSQPVPEFAPYADGPADTAEVFGYVPVDVVVAVIDAHGGLMTAESNSAF